MRRAIGVVLAVAILVLATGAAAAQDRTVPAYQGSTWRDVKKASVPLVEVRALRADHTEPKDDDVVVAQVPFAGATDSTNKLAVLLVPAPTGGRRVVPLASGPGVTVVRATQVLMQHGFESVDVPAGARSDETVVSQSPAPGSVAAVGERMYLATAGETMAAAEEPASSGTVIWLSVLVVALLIYLALRALYAFHVRPESS